jgi:hypothetical protein
LRGKNDRRIFLAQRFQPFTELSSEAVVIERKPGETAQ